MLQRWHFFQGEHCLFLQNSRGEDVQPLHSFGGMVEDFLVDFLGIWDAVALFGGLSESSETAAILLVGMSQLRRFGRLVTVPLQLDGVCGNALSVTS